MAEVLINAKKIHKAWGDKVLFDDLDFRIHKGQKLAFLGRNGSGKSTLIRILGGLETDFEGEVQYKKALSLCFRMLSPVSAYALSCTREAGSWLFLQSFGRLLKDVQG